MNSLTIDLNEQHLKKIEQELLAMPKEAPSALKKAVNATARKAKTQLSIETRRRYATKAAGVNQGMKLNSAKVGKLEANIIVKGEMKEIKDFKASPLTVSNGKNRPEHIKAKVLKSSSMKPLEHGGIKAFMAKFKSGHVAVVERVPGKKMKSNPKKEFLQKLLSPSAPHMVGNKEVYGEVEPQIKTLLEENIERELLKVKGGA